jgi:hypothetical protein
MISFSERNAAEGAKKRLWRRFFFTLVAEHIAPLFSYADTL